MTKPILLTKPFLPPQEEYHKLVDEILARNWLTNDGPLVRRLEAELSEYLSVPHLAFVTNGTIALQLAIKSLGNQGEIITTPFSYVATTSSIVWEGFEPVFADIDPHTWNLDPARAETLITPKTKAILATHVYGNPCDIEAFETLGNKYNIKIIYDSAHAFGVMLKGQSIFNFGDISTTSFHATKIFHTIEGGAVFLPNEELLHRIKMFRNFGHNGVGIFDGVGINGKNSEFHAAMGICNLPHVDAIIAKRKMLSDYYDSSLKNLGLLRPHLDKSIKYNYAYYAVAFSSEHELTRVINKLESEQISTRRYFYPLLNTLDYVKGNSCPIAENIGERVLCLPLYPSLEIEEIDRICEIIVSGIKADN